MNETTSDVPESGPEAEEKGGEPRRARSIRFSDSEWESVEIAASQRGMNAAEFARHAALGVASGRYGAEPGALPSQYANLIERIFRSTHILVTLKRDKLMREGRGDECTSLSGPPGSCMNRCWRYRRIDNNTSTRAELTRQDLPRCGGLLPPSPFHLPTPKSSLAWLWTR